MTPTGVCEQAPGQWRWVRTCLARVGRPQYFERGWPAVVGPDNVPTIEKDIARWQHYVWRERSVLLADGQPANEVLNPL